MRNPFFSKPPFSQPLLFFFHPWTLAVVIWMCMVAPGCAVFHGAGTSATGVIKPGAPWVDDQGHQIQAHGGGIIKIGKLYYWFGEYRGRDVEPGYRYVGCYSSPDLAHWTYRNKIRFSAPQGFRPDRWVLERPKVFYNAATGKYVMYFHLDTGNYSAAELGVAVSGRIDSGYKIVRHFRPFGMESRDIGQFIDDDGQAYLIFESRPTHGFVIARLSEDYLDVAQKVCLIKEPIEGGALVHYHGLYYMIGSHLTGWKPNPNLYATAPSLAGPWSSFRDIAPPAANTYGSQSTMMLKVEGSRDTTVIFMGDIWKPATQWDSRYLWMPLQIRGTDLVLPKPAPWKINIRTGKYSLVR